MPPFNIKMGKTDLEILIDGCGDLARGFKKLKSVLTKLKSQSDSAGGTKTPFLSQCVPVLKNLVSHGTEILSSDSAGGTKTPFLSQSESVSKPTDPPYMWEIFSPRVFLLSHECNWGRSFSRSLIRYLIGETLRGDKFSNHWVKKSYGWRKVPKRFLELVFDHCVMCWKDCTDLIEEYPSLDQFQQNVGEIHRGRFHKAYDVLESKFTYKQFIFEVRENHDELEPLRQRRKR